MENSKIAWCDDTVNFWWGCQKVAPGCAACYALDITTRFAGNFWGPMQPRLWIKSACDTLLKLNRKAEREGEPRLVFVNSMSDLFEDFDGPIFDRHGRRLLVQRDGTGAYIQEPSSYSIAGVRLVTLNDLRREAFATIDECRSLRCILLTKRPENIRRMWPERSFENLHWYYRDNAILLTSISEQETADRNVPHLANCHDLAPVLGVSLEPMLGPVDFGWLANSAGEQYGLRDGILQWVIVGCESNGSRVGRLGSFKNEADWRAGAADVVRQCREAGVACYMKQVPINGRVSHDPAEWPEALRVREFPVASASTAVRERGA